MKSNVTKRIDKIMLVIVVFFVLYSISYFIENYSIVKNTDLQVTSSTNKMVEPSNTTTSGPLRVNEDADVYGQRQLRADYNNGSSSVGY